MTDIKRVDDDVANPRGGCSTNPSSFKCAWSLYKQAVEEKNNVLILRLACDLLFHHQSRLRRSNHDDAVIERALFCAIELGLDEWVDYLAEKVKSTCPKSEVDSSDRMEKIDLSLLSYGEDFSKSIEYCRLRIEDEVQNKDFRYRLAQLYCSDGNPKQAMKILVAHTREYPNDSVALKLMLRIYTMNGNISEAIHVQEDIILSDGNVAHFLTLAELLATAGETEIAVEYFSQVLLKDSKNLRALWELLMILKAQDSHKPHYNDLTSKVLKSLKGVLLTDDSDFSCMISDILKSVEACEIEK
eukprot:GHVH01005073.1.p1 GENE.GHVH01005073.1~~GHVH01005073.1.p1  ORF type:complete len:301 (+),score=48.06 GHVH01005073.1:26-928(+)